MSTSIATLSEFAYAIHATLEAAAEHVLLLELAEGLVVEEIGERDTYPTSAKAVALAASARAYFNPRGTAAESTGGATRSFPSAQMGVYLTEDEVDALHRATAPAPAFEFPCAWPYPDAVERPAGTVSS